VLEYCDSLLIIQGSKEGSSAVSVIDAYLEAAEAMLEQAYSLL